MKNLIPELIAIDHDDYCASRVGHMANGNQFFVTSPFEPAVNGGAGREYLATYIFDATGRLIDSKIDDLGPRDPFDEDRARALRQRRMAELGEVVLGRIEIAPFSVEHNGCVFGFVVREPDSEGDSVVVEVQPGNYMAFFSPWNSGVYDT